MKILTWQARNDKRISLVKLSQMTGISKSTLNNIENEKVSPTMAELEAIAKALDVRITDLFDSDYMEILCKNDKNYCINVIVQKRGHAYGL